MAKYIEGFVIPMPKKNVKKYRKIAKKACEVWMKHGALHYLEAVGHNLNVAGVYTFPKMTKAKSSETVVFAYIVYKSKAHRDRVFKKVMNDPWIANHEHGDMPFDMKRMAYGGFKSIVES